MRDVGVRLSALKSKPKYKSQYICKGLVDLHSVIYSSYSFNILLNMLWNHIVMHCSLYLVDN
ncbi:hypothetical protein Sjap_002668 [Stephania japonica]|uniref:Uncharacterized protein n=1 Tax=Stephania japonica TaxID=461633 RepID=A0AAP0KMC0_9MAGN